MLWKFHAFAGHLPHSLVTVLTELSLPNTVRVIKWKRVWLVWYLACVERWELCTMFWLVNLKGRHIWETGTYWGVRWGGGNADISFAEIGYNASDWIHLAQERVWWCAVVNMCKHGDGLFASIKGMNFLMHWVTTSFCKRTAAWILLSYWCTMDTWFIKFLSVCQRVTIEQRFLLTDWLIYGPKLDFYNYMAKAYLKKKTAKDYNILGYISMLIGG